MKNKNILENDFKPYVRPRHKSNLEKRIVTHLLELLLKNKISRINNYY